MYWPSFINRLHAKTILYLITENIHIPSSVGIDISPPFLGNFKMLYPHALRMRPLLGLASPPRFRNFAFLFRIPEKPKRICDVLKRGFDHECCKHVSITHKREIRQAVVNFKIWRFAGFTTPKIVPLHRLKSTTRNNACSVMQNSKFNG